MNVLVTGGAGYIGSHTVVRLLAEGHEVTIVDDFSNSSPKVVDRLMKLSDKKVSLYSFDLSDHAKLSEVFTENTIDAVIHFAGLKAVGESVAQPLKYYRTNLDSTLSLLECMQRAEVFKLVFSSSATVYGSAAIPYREDDVVGQGITNPYGQTKYIIECILRDTAASDDRWYIGSLRYFNPVGAHPSGMLGEQPQGTPNNLMPYVTQVAAGLRDKLSIFGNDYDTPDGTCIRDYIHVDDLADGHLTMLEHIQPGFDAINLGSGRGVSVLELVQAFERVNDLILTYGFAPRREGDLPSYFADATKAKKLLGWQTTRTLDDMCRDSWRWQKQNPKGYE